MATATRQNPVKDANNTSVRVEIFDQAYNLRGSDPEYILKLADYVDSKMRAVAGRVRVRRGVGWIADRTSGRQTRRVGRPRSRWPRGSRPMPRAPLRSGRR